MENVMKKYPHIHLNVMVSDTVPEDMPEYGMIFATHGNGRQEKILSEIIKKYPRC